ncbi:protein of unknown function [Saccharicrinis carchari]|uniref:DUF4837 domain-containing protein n=1 Tax=Saccharicrinis carchari TaxID=1168039 RepID=A0A521E6X5_SACCC|nr:DUF4837 family protein [Saccharicrinis carchari]SMO79694.1 protein of unknown function [Saccharicrinis carchari]
MKYNTILSHHLTHSLVLLCFLYLSACVNLGTDIKNRAIGTPGEVLVVMDNNIQQSQVQKIIQAFANAEFPNLPQSEPTFKLTTVIPKNFEGHFRAYRNIIIIQQSILSKTDVSFQRNVWALQQQVVDITLSDTNDFADLFKAHEKEIFDFIYQGDISNIQNANLKVADAAAQRFIKQKHNLYLVIPPGFRLVKDTANFCWFRLDRLETDMHLVIQSFDMDSLPAIHNRALLALLDRVGKEYIPGPYALTFKQTEKNLPILFSKISINEQNVTELRGLWRVEGYFMGGPFVTIFIKDDSRNKLLMLDGFVHAAQNQNKAYYVRQIEAILHSVKIL